MSSDSNLTGDDNLDSGSIVPYFRLRLTCKLSSACVTVLLATINNLLKVSYFINIYFMKSLVNTQHVRFADLLVYLGITCFKTENLGRDRYIHNGILYQTVNYRCRKSSSTHLYFLTSGEFCEILKFDKESDCYC